MPDLISHSLAARIVLAGRWTKYLLLFTLGTILPDVLSRVPIFFGAGCYRCCWFFNVLHSPLVLVVFVAMLSLTFLDKKRAFLSLLGGMAFHLALDSLQRHMEGGYLWLFPFSFRTAEFGLFRPETSLYFIPFLAGAGLLVYASELYLRGQRVRKRGTKQESELG